MDKQINLKEVRCKRCRGEIELYYDPNTTKDGVITTILIGVCKTCEAQIKDGAYDSGRDAGHTECFNQICGHDMGR